MIVNATEFKAKCLEILDQVNRTGEVVTITKRGKVVAELRPPYDTKPRQSGRGSAIGKITILGDIVEPLDVEWEVIQ
jgi:antitoxin (DNA-binding transcriptional repressor) of toxin-antitoxin stability system